MKVLCIGDVMLDVISKISVIPQSLNFGSDTSAATSTHGGGAGGNVASWLRIAGSESYLVARLGNDSAGNTLRSELETTGVEHGGLLVDGVSTGVVVVLLDPTGERTMLASTSANSGLNLADLPELDNFQGVYLSGYALLDPISRPEVLKMISKIGAVGIPIYFDPATVGGMSAVDKKEILSWLPNMYAIILNEEEAHYLSNESSNEAALLQLLQYVHVVVIKEGSRGAIGQERNGSPTELSAPQVTMIDTTGAGDSFAAGFITEHLRSSDLTSSISSGIAIAAHCVAIVGARPPVGTKI
jgi:ribokinase